MICTVMQAECNLHSACMGIEYETGEESSQDTDWQMEGFNDCILIRSMSGGMVDCVAVHGAPCQGWTIYGKPQAEGWGILAHGRVVDADEASDISPHEWRGDTVGGGLGEKTLIECQAECNLHDECFGIEYADADVEDNTAGFADCILISSASELVDCGEVHGAGCDGWTIYGKPSGRAASAWTFMRRGRVVDAEEYTDVEPHEWRGDTVGGGLGELSLAECQNACDLYEGCFGIEYESGDSVDNTAGFADCILIRSANVMVDCMAVHGAACDGWNIYAKPERLREGFVAQPPDERDWPLIESDKRVADPEEDRFEDPWEWRSGEMTLGECKAEVISHFNRLLCARSYQAAHCLCLCLCLLSTYARTEEQRR